MAPPCHPCLPLELVEKLKADSDIFIERSSIFEPTQEKFRLRVLKASEDRMSVEIEVVLEKDNPPESRLFIEGPSGSSAPDPIDRFIPEPNRRVGKISSEQSKFRKGDKKTFLHFAALKADLALAYEMIRMGVDIEWKDRTGTTALLACLIQLAAYRNILIAVSSPRFPPPPRGVPLAESLRPSWLTKKIGCMERIAILLIEQHADIEATAHGYTPIRLAAEAGRGKIVELLLRHGARRPRFEDISFLSSLDKSRYKSLISKTKTVNPRPPRPCPCWSGKLLSECHEKEDHPYPNHFLCRCGRKRVYGECCGKRGLRVIERWDPKDKWIMTSDIRSLHSGKNLVEPEMQQYFEEGLEDNLNRFHEMDQTARNQVVEMLQAHKSTLIKGMVRSVDSNDEVDEAWWYTLDRTDFIPRPWENQLSKIESRKRMNEWNAVVDQYIATQGDPRDRLQIEVAAKIGIDGGPLYKACSAQNCGAIEKIDVPSLRKCSGCGIAMYCSKECQAKSWKVEGHKNICKSGEMTPQLSRSQRSLEKAFRNLQVANGMAAMVGDADRAREQMILRMSEMLIEPVD